MTRGFRGKPRSPGASPPPAPSGRLVQERLRAAARVLDAVRVRRQDLAAVGLLCLALGLSALSSGPSLALTTPVEAGCGGSSVWAAAASYNAVSETNLVVSLFGAPETGWEIYAPRVQATLKTVCAPGDLGFAQELARFKAAHALTPDGAMTAETMQIFKGLWQEARPFVMARLTGRCPAGAEEAALEPLAPPEVFGDKAVSMRRDALRALRRLRDAARLEAPTLFADPSTLSVFSAYRSPASDAQRCRLEGNCQGRSRAECSPHRTGLAADLQLGELPGRLADDAAPPNRLFQSRSPAYLWLLANAGRFGFVNYAYEPWHWEWAPGAF